MKVVTAPDFIIPNRNKYVTVFLAGGITNCPDWQSETINELKKFEVENNKELNLIVYNPRRESFDIDTESERDKQIEWEFKYINSVDIFSMYFCNSESVQPICMYELGMRIGRLMERPAIDSHRGCRTVVSIEKGFKREYDIYKQLNLACWEIGINYNATPYSHAMHIIMEYMLIADEKFAQEICRERINNDYQ